MTKATTTLVAAVILLLLFAALGDFSAQPTNLSLFLGRFHTIIVHLPIGALLIAPILEFLSRRTGRQALQPLVPVALLIGAWSAVLAALTGLLMAQGGGYVERTLFWHRLLGLGIPVLATIGLMLDSMASRRRSFQSARPATTGLLMLAVLCGGHLGGGLAHQEGYLTRYMPDGLRSVLGLSPESGRTAVELARSTAYQSIVRPILETRCTNCHNPTANQGGLSLDSEARILAGGSSGPALVRGHARASAMIRRIWLPLGHSDHMPPEGRPQITVAEAELLRWWIDSGASFERTLADSPFPDPVRTILDGMGWGEIKTGIFALQVPEPDPRALASARKAGLSVTRISQGAPFLDVRCPDPGPCLDVAQTTALKDLARNVAWLDLGASDIGDEDIGAIREFPHLTRIDLHKTRITDAGLRDLTGFAYLEYLNLYGTAVSNEGLGRLPSLPALKTLYLWQTAATEDGARQLEGARPGLTVSLGVAVD